MKYSLNTELFQHVNTNTQLHFFLASRLSYHKLRNIHELSLVRPSRSNAVSFRRHNTTALCSPYGRLPAAIRSIDDALAGHARLPSLRLLYNKTRYNVRICPACSRWYRHGEGFGSLATFEEFLSPPNVLLGVCPEIAIEQHVRYSISVVDTLMSVGCPSNHPS